MCKKCSLKIPVRDIRRNSYNRLLYTTLLRQRKYKGRLKKWARQAPAGAALRGDGPRLPPRVSYMIMRYSPPQVLFLINIPLGDIHVPQLCASELPNRVNVTECKRRDPKQSNDSCNLTTH